MYKVHNLLANVPGSLPEELIEPLVSAPSVRIERIVSLAHASPLGFWYDQETAEFVVLLRGRARLRIEGQTDEVEMEPGDALHLPAHCRHRVEWTDPAAPTIWLAIHHDGHSQQ